MSDAPAADPYVTAKANLRDTIKWLATSLAAVGAAVIAGASINGLASLQGPALILAAALGGVGLIAILIAIAIMVRLLTSNVFYFSDLTTANNPIANEINSHATDILSPQTPSIAELVAFRDRAVAALRVSQAGDVQYQAAFRNWTAANDLIARVTNLGQFLSLRRDFQTQQCALFGLTVMIIVTLGGYALLAGGKASLTSDLAMRVVFKPGANWSEAATSLATACGSDPLNASILQKKSFEGWVSIRLAQPGKCGDLELTVPSSLVQFIAPSP